MLQNYLAKAVLVDFYGFIRIYIYIYTDTDLYYLIADIAVDFL